MAGRIHRVTIMVLIASVLVLTEMNFANLAHGQQTKGSYETTAKRLCATVPVIFTRSSPRCPKASRSTS